jgi:hypothetical protein
MEVPHFDPGAAGIRAPAVGCGDEHAAMHPTAMTATNPIAFGIGEW